MSEMSTSVCRSKASPSEVSAPITMRKASIKVGLVVVARDVNIG